MSRELEIQEKGKENPLFSSFQTRIILLSFFSYFFYYFVRKNLGVVTPALIEEGVFTEKQIGWAQTGYLFVYMIGQFLSGAMGDKFGPRLLIGVGMFASALVSIGIGLLPFYWILLGLWSLNGIFQSTGWSNNCKLITSWVPHYKRGRVMGIWAMCYVLGSISANFVAGYVMGEYNWQAAFIVTGGMVLVVAVVQAIMLINTPEDVGYTFERRSSEPSDKVDSSGSFMRMLKNPTILMYGSSYFSLKFIRYTFFTWLPYYLVTSLGYDKSISAYTANSFEIGGVLGIIVGGVLADTLFAKNRGRLAFYGMIGLIISLVGFRMLADAGFWIVVVALAIVGIFLYIADSLVSGTAAQDVGGAEGAASATGIVNGIGSIGGALSGIVPVYVKDTFGWDGVFILFILLSIVATLVLIPVAMKKEVMKA